MAVGHDPRRLAAVEEQARMIVGEAERLTDRREDLAVVYVEADSVQRVLHVKRVRTGGLDGGVAGTPSNPPQS